MPLDASVGEAIWTALTSGKDHGGNFTLYHMSPALENTLPDISDKRDPRCCDHIITAATDALMSTFLILSCQNIPINVHFDTGCLQTKVVSERVANFTRRDGGKLRQTNVVSTSGVGGVSYSV